MSKKNFFSLIFLVLFFNTQLLSNEIKISVIVDDQIITNYDIEKEGQYLKILNPNLINLENKKIQKIAKDSLVNEIIKKKEIEKIIDFKKDNIFVNEYLKDLYTKLNYSNEIEFQNSLLNKESYSLKEIKEKIKIEILWNEFIFLKYRDQIRIDTTKLSKKIQVMSNETKTEYLLSEIVFQKNNEDLENLIKKIKFSISEIGFNNTANIYSIAESSKLGGKIGWIDENNLSEIIYENLNKISKDEFTDVIPIGNNFLILKIEDTRSKKISINKEEQLKKMIKFETNKQLNQFSRIYFNKAKLNYLINET